MQFFGVKMSVEKRGETPVCPEISGREGEGRKAKNAASARADAQSRVCGGRKKLFAFHTAETSCLLPRVERAFDDIFVNFVAGFCIVHLVTDLRYVLLFR